MTPVVAASSAATTSAATSASTVATVCEEVAGPAGAPITDPAMTGTSFGPLAVEPALRVRSSGPVVDASYVPGGVLITAGPEQGPTALTFVEDAGAVRWHRCFDAPTWAVTTLVPPAAALPTRALVAVSDDEGGGSVTESIDLTTGESTPLPLGTAPTSYLWAADSEHALFGPTLEASELPAGSYFTLVELTTLTSVAIPSPELPADVTFPSYQLGAGGLVGLAGRDGSASSIALAYADGSWSSDAARIDAAFPLWTDYASEGPTTFRLASGSPAWSVDLVPAPDEGFHDASSGGVELMRGCTEIDTTSYECVGEALVGIDAAAGTELWRFDGPHGVAAAADGYAIVSAPVGSAPNAALPAGETAPTDTYGFVDWNDTMIDVTTGQAVEGQVWSSGAFWLGCCGDPSFTAIEGGVVVTSDGFEVSVYVPLAAATPTVDTTI